MKSIYEAAYQTFLTLLVEARNAQGMTQQQLADKLGRPQSFVSKVENGERRVDIIEFLELCQILRRDPYELLKRVDAHRRRR